MSRILISGLLALTCAGAWSLDAPIAWQARWNEALFAEAGRTHRFVLLDLHAVWCHWCHVMDEETYADPKVRRLIAAHYVPVSIDADADPALTSRYGDWGWPATIVLAADGTEIVKRRGFIPPEQMASLLQAIIDDPTPGPSVEAAAAPKTARSPALEPAQRAGLVHTYEALYDPAHGGWGEVHKYLDAPTMEYTLAHLDAPDTGKTAESRARQTLDANLTLIDPVWGGVYQYSDAIDWRSPHFEKLLAFQADDLRLYSLAWARWRDPRYLDAARALHRYLVEFLRSPEGAFYVSQDADLSQEVTGHAFYARDDGQRRALGIPRVDTHLYARENGWAITALCRYHDVTGEAAPLEEARRAAEWVLAHRALPAGGFRHGEADVGGPFLGDSLAMGQAFLALYRSSGERHWLEKSRAAMAFIQARFKDPRGGYISAPPAAGASGVFREPVRALDENSGVVRLANRLRWESGDKRYAGLAAHGMRYLASVAREDRLEAEILVADAELVGPPVHITIVGGRHDPAAAALHAAALTYPAEYLQVDWWDRSEGPPPSPEITYPALPRAAAFACTANSCSTPVFEPECIAPAVRAAL